MITRSQERPLESTPYTGILQAEEMQSIQCPGFRIFVGILFVLFIGAGFPGTSISANKSIGEQKNPYADAEITIEIKSSANKTFGYDILVHGKPLVHQPNIPGLPGNEGFTTEERARTTAEFVVKKIRKNEMPPTVTIEDLNHLGLLK